MGVSTGRTQKRIAKEVVAELARPSTSPTKETAISQNVSSRGVRLATERDWHAGDRVLLSSPELGFHGQARVVYCQRLDNERFAVGLEFLPSLGEWTKPHSLAACVFEHIISFVSLLPSSSQIRLNVFLRMVPYEESDFSARDESVSTIIGRKSGTQGSTQSDLFL